jgi:hypothetical protein
MCHALGSLGPQYKINVRLSSVTALHSTEQVTHILDKLVSMDVSLTACFIHLSYYLLDITQSPL